MANNRMRIRCIPCDKTVTIAKRMASGYYINSGGYALKVRLCRFFAEHEWCAGTLEHGQDKFDLVYQDGINPSHATRYEKPTGDT